MQHSRATQYKTGPNVAITHLCAPEYSLLISTVGGEGLKNQTLHRIWLILHCVVAVSIERQISVQYEQSVSRSRGKGCSSSDT